MISRIHLKFLVAILASAGLSESAFGQQISAEEMVEQLMPRPKTRSVGGDRQTRGIQVEGRTTQNAALNLYINFEYDSDELKQDALIVLDRLAQALESERLSKFDFLIAGHTDAVGSDAYNQQLSERRAKVVRQYLEARKGIPAGRLLDRGFGETRLLDPDKPEDGANRRVQIVTLSIPEQ